MSRYTELLDQIDEAHDFEDGQTYGHGGTAMSSTDVCRICGLKRLYFTDSQNGVDSRWTFETHCGKEIPLREAAELEC